MEYPSPRIDAWVLALFLAGVGCLAIPDAVMLYQLRWVMVFWTVAVLLFVCGFPAVQKRLRIMWEAFVTLYGRVAVLYPYGAPIAMGLAVIVVGILLFVGGNWLLIREDAPSSPVSPVQEKEPLVRMEPEREMIFADKDGTFPLLFVNAGPDVDNVVLLFDYFVAQRATNGEVVFKRISHTTCKLAPDLRSVLSGGVPVKVKFGSGLLAAYQQAATAFSGPSLLGVRIVSTFQRASDGEEFEFGWVYGCEGAVDNCEVLTT